MMLPPLEGLHSPTGGNTRHSSRTSQEVAAGSSRGLLKPVMREEERNPQAGLQTKPGLSLICGQGRYNFSFSSTRHN